MPDQPWLFFAWIIYPVFGVLLYFTNLKLSLIFGLIFLLYPPIYIASYNSVASTELDIVNVQRVFASSPSPTVNVIVDFRLSASLESLPASRGDMTLYLSVNGTNSYDCSWCLLAKTNVTGGTLFPYGHLDYRSTFASSDSRVIRYMNETWTRVDLFTNVAVSSLMYNHTLGLGTAPCWDWRTGKSHWTLVYNYLC